MVSCQHCGDQHPNSVTKCARTAEAMRTPGPCGTKIDRYQVKTLLGMGGFGAVYRAEHARTGAPIALKLLRRGKSMERQVLERFMQEARAAAAIGNDHIVRVLDADAKHDVAFIAMELLEGMDLKRLDRTEGPLHPARIVPLMLQVLEGLAAAQGKGVVHRDMKPANVFVSPGDVVKVLDFGISRMRDAEQRKLTLAGSKLGTPGYMAYEQFYDARDVDARTDLYAVAVMLYELLSGKRPFKGDRFEELLVRVRDEEPVPLRTAVPRLPVPLCAIVDKGLQRKRERRWQSAREMIKALNQVAALLIAPVVWRGKRSKEPGADGEQETEKVG